MLILEFLKDFSIVGIAELYLRQAGQPWQRFPVSECFWLYTIQCWYC